MYTKKELQKLRDLLISEFNRGKYLSTLACGRTAAHICSVLMDSCDPNTIFAKLNAYAVLTRGLVCLNNDVDYELAFDMLFGDISVVPLHINDALETVAAWRLKQAETKKADLVEQPF